MKKCMAILSAAVVLLSMSACGGQKAPETKPAASTTKVVLTESPTEAPTEGRYDEKSAYYVFIPDDWCKMEYAGDRFKIRLFDVASAPDIEQGKTGEVMIEVEKEDAEYDKILAEHKAYEGAKDGKGMKIGGHDFACVTYTYPAEKRTYTVYVGKIGDTVATVKVKGLKVEDETVAKILGSITFKEKIEKEVADQKPSESTKADENKKAETKAAAKAGDKTTAKAANSTTSEEKK